MFKFFTKKKEKKISAYNKEVIAKINSGEYPIVDIIKGDNYRIRYLDGVVYQKIFIDDILLLNLEEIPILN